MKTNVLNLTTALILLTNLAFGQTKFYKTDQEKIVDTKTYKKMKADYFNSVNGLFPVKDRKITILDNFKEIKRTKDSVIYAYKWDIHIGDVKAKTHKVFEPDSLLNKEFELPTFSTLNGKTINLNSLKKKPTLINFWFTSCKPCIDEMPILNKIKKQLKDSVNFVAITYESTEKVKIFLKKHQFNYLQIANAKKFTSSMNMESFPVNIFLDKDGIVRKIENGIPYVIGEKGDVKLGDGKEFLNILRELL